MRSLQTSPESPPAGSTTIAHLIGLALTFLLPSGSCGSGAVPACNALVTTLAGSDTIDILASANGASSSCLPRRCAMSSRRWHSPISWYAWSRRIWWITRRCKRSSSASLPERALRHDRVLHHNRQILLSRASRRHRRREGLSEARRIALDVAAHDSHRARSHRVGRDQREHVDRRNRRCRARAVSISTALFRRLSNERGRALATPCAARTRQYAAVAQPSIW